MSDAPLGEGWWLASDGKYYAPELHPDFVSPPPQTAPPQTAPPQTPPPYQDPAFPQTLTNPRGAESDSAATGAHSGKPLGPPTGPPVSAPVWMAPSDSAQQTAATGWTAQPNAAPAWATNAPAEPSAVTQVNAPVPWYQTWWAIGPGLFLCFPVGLVLLWTSRKEAGWKVGISIACALLVVISALGSGGSELPAKENASVGIRESTTSLASAPTTRPPTTTMPPTTATLPPATTTVPPTTTTAPPPPPAPPVTSPPAANGTISQQNARKSASDYLEVTAFSRSGLIEQLQYEGFSGGDATFAVDSLDIDWNAQAAKSAAEYLSVTSFSRSGLVDQLIYEGFSLEQADYGVSTTGL